MMHTGSVLDVVHIGKCLINIVIDSADCVNYVDNSLKIERIIILYRNTSEPLFCRPARELKPACYVVHAAANVENAVQLIVASESGRGRESISR